MPWTVMFDMLLLSLLLSFYCSTIITALGRQSWHIDNRRIRVWGEHQLKKKRDVEVGVLRESTTEFCFVFNKLLQEICTAVKEKVKHEYRQGHNRICYYALVCFLANVILYNELLFEIIRTSNWHLSNHHHLGRFFLCNGRR